MNEDEGMKIGEKFFPFVRVTESMQPKILKRVSKLDWRAVLYDYWKQKKRNKYIAERNIKIAERTAYLKEHPEETIPENPPVTYKDLIAEGLIYVSIYQSKREWKIIRSIAFQKNLLWKYFGIVPYELRCNVIETKKAREIKKKFDKYLTEATQDQDEPTNSSSNLPTANSEAK